EVLSLTYAYGEVRSLTGNELSQQINGHYSDDVLDGGGGNDIIDGWDGDDQLLGGVGNDRMDGGAGNDRLNGGLGADQRFGGACGDIFVVDNPYDTVDEVNGWGIDPVQSSISFSLENTARVFGVFENLTLSGAGNIDGTGNALDNVITGNSGSNVLAGGGGN